MTSEWNLWVWLVDNNVIGSHLHSQSFSINHNHLVTMSYIHLLYHSVAVLAVSICACAD